MVVTFGEIMLRLAPPGFERLLQTPQFAASFAGGEANVAVALASFGDAARFVTVLPADNPIADAAVGELRRHGVDTQHIVWGRGRMGVYYLETGLASVLLGFSTIATGAPSRWQSPEISTGPMRSKARATGCELGPSSSLNLQALIVQSEVRSQKYGLGETVRVSTTYSPGVR